MGLKCGGLAEPPWEIRRINPKSTKSKHLLESQRFSRNIQPFSENPFVQNLKTLQSQKIRAQPTFNENSSSEYTIFLLREHMVCKALWLNKHVWTKPILSCITMNLFPSPKAANAQKEQQEGKYSFPVKIPRNSCSCKDIGLSARPNIVITSIKVFLGKHKFFGQ